MNPHDTEKIEWSILIVIIIGTFMAILDSSIVNVALPKMMVIFNVSTDDIQWILTAYMLTLGVVMPLSGYLGDTYGYKRVYMIALGLFIAGSFLCGLAWNVNSMIAARIVQALGGGIMQPLGMAIIYQSFPRSKIGMVLGFWGIASMAAPAIGPTLGGYLVDYVNWRLIFFINIPIGIINFFLAGMILRETPLIKGKHLDYIGVFTSVIGLFCLLLALSEGTKEGWTSPYIVSLFAVSAVTLVWFVFNELTHPEPILDLRVFKNVIFTISIIIGSFLAIGMFGAIFLLPLLLQNVFGQTAMKTGLIMVPGAIASGLMMPISGR
ncbi:MAG: DHA2 family efflux MFS transporter permease subunit, partial [Candidatus Saccharibacteria bacterium]